MISLTNHIPEDALLWRNNPIIQKWCRQYTLISLAQHKKWLEKIETDPSIKMFGIVNRKRSNEEHEIGVCGFTSIDKHNQSAEFSLYIAAHVQRQGFGKRALRALFEHGFLHMNFNRIWGEMFEGNPAEKTFITLGLKKEGTLRKSHYREGRFIDSHIYAILRNDWVCSTQDT